MLVQPVKHDVIEECDSVSEKSPDFANHGHKLFNILSAPQPEALPPESSSDHSVSRKIRLLPNKGGFYEVYKLFNIRW
jgi:hypothetical protein